MQQQMEKLLHFTDAVMKNAVRESDELRKQLEETRTQALERVRDEAKEAARAEHKEKEKEEDEHGGDGH